MYGKCEMSEYISRVEKFLERAEGFCKFFDYIMDLHQFLLGASLLYLKYLKHSYFGLQRVPTLPGFWDLKKPRYVKFVLVGL